MAGVFRRKSLSLEDVSEVPATIITEDLYAAAVGITFLANRSRNLVVKTGPPTATAELILAIVKRGITTPADKYTIHLEVVVLSRKRHLRSFVNDDTLFLRRKGIEVVRTFHVIKTHEGLTRLKGRWQKTDNRSPPKVSTLSKRVRISLTQRLVCIMVPYQKSLFLLLLLFISSNNYGQGSNATTACSESMVAEYEARIEGLDEQDVLDFLRLTNAECYVNSVFLAFYNEVLFKILDRHHSAFSVALNRLAPLNRKIILSELSFPVSDGIPLDSIRQRLSGTEAEMIKRALDLAVAKMESTGADTIPFQKSDNINPVLEEVGAYAAGIDLNDDGVQDMIITSRDGLEKQRLVTIELSGKTVNSHILYLNIPDDDLLWVETFELIPKGTIIAPTLIDNATGDILGVDVEQSVILLADAVRMLPAETEGALVIYIENGTLRHMYE